MKTPVSIFSQWRYIRVCYAEDGGNFREDTDDFDSPYGVDLVPGGWYTLPRKWHDVYGEISENTF